ncbi:MAG: hypothetical protein EBR82_86490 [Caulobacteraceae bacterium]|nr:hypothetical protein [Caulobacteraceae bacterium]
MIAETTKRCPHCKRLKPAAAFHSDRSKRDGLGSWCRHCNSMARSKSAVPEAPDLYEYAPLPEPPAAPALLVDYAARRTLTVTADAVTETPFADYRSGAPSPKTLAMLKERGWLVIEVRE